MTNNPELIAANINARVMMVQCQVQAMIAENQWRADVKESQAYSSEHFFNLGLELEALLKKHNLDVPGG